MKKYYIVVDTCKDGKYLSVADSFPENENIIAVVNRWQFVKAISIFPTREKALQVAEERNEVYKQNGII